MHLLLLSRALSFIHSSSILISPFGLFFLLSFSLSQDGTTTLYLVAQNGQLEIVKLLLDRGADVNEAVEVKQAST